MSLVPSLLAHRARVLIVDDQPKNRQLLEVMLSQEGFDLVTAERGDEALSIVARQPPDLILLDVMMPGIDGYQVAAKIKGNPATRHIAIIMVSALHDSNAKQDAVRAGVDDFVTKPVDREELLLRVRRLLHLVA